MAAFDGSQSLLAASDEQFDHVCGLCQKIDGKEKEAKRYCNDCSEYLCDSCVDSHIKFPLLKNHKITDAGSVSVSSGRRITVYCCCNKNQEVDFYCKEHDDVICSLCKSFKHHNCQTSPIQQKSSGYATAKLGYATAKLESIISRTKFLKAKYDQLKQKCIQNKKELKLSKETCKKEIKDFRKELDSFLNKLEQKMLAELEQLETKEQLRIDQQIKTLTTALHILDTDYHTLDAAKTDGRIHVMFAADIQTSKSFQDCSSRLTDLDRDVKNFFVSFEKNKKLADLQKGVTTLGTLETIEKISERRHKIVLLGQHVVSRREVNVRMTDDKEDPWISGCVVMPNDYIVICDQRNKKLKLLDNTWSVTDSCEMSDPWDVSVLDNNNVIVTISDEKKLQQVQVFPQLKVDRTIQLDKKCWGVKVSGENIYVSCGDRNVIGVIVLDKQGNVPLEYSRRRPDWFPLPYITVSRGGDRIFVSDSGNDTITCMAADGSIIYQYTDKDLIRPRGMYCDDGNNILVCCSGSNTVQMITAEGKLYNTMLSSKDGLNAPYSIVYKQSDNALIIGCLSLDHLLVYHLTK